MADEDKRYPQFVKLDTDDNGFYGVVYSEDNGIHKTLLVGSKGLILRQKDADHIWPFLVDKVKSVMSVSWDQIQGKPELVVKSDLKDLATKDEIKKIEKEPGPPGQTWQPYVGDDGNWHLKLIISGGEI